MEKSLKWIFGILLLVIPFTVCVYPEYILEEECRIGNETILYHAPYLGSVGRLKTTLNPPYKMNKNCKIAIKPPPGYGVVISIEKIDFRQPSFQCMDYLKIFHFDLFFSPTTLCRFRFDLKGSLSYYSKGRMEMRYYVHSKLSDGLNVEEGFSLIYTVVSEDEQDCEKASMFMCDNQRCIPKNLTCDMKNNCGDNSDESHFLCDSPHQDILKVTDIMLGIVVCIFLIVTLSVFITLASRKRRLLQEVDSDSDEPTTKIAPYQSVHPKGFFICQNPAGPKTPASQHLKMIVPDGGFSNPCYTQDPPPYCK